MMTALAQPKFRNDEHRRQHEDWKRARARMAANAKPEPKPVVIAIQEAPAAPEIAKPVDRPAYPPWTPAEDDTLREMIAQGKSLREIGEHLNRSRGAVGKRIERLGIVPHRKLVLHAAPDMQRILRETAAHFGVGTEDIRSQSNNPRRPNVPRSVFVWRCRNEGASGGEIQKFLDSASTNLSFRAVRMVERLLSEGRLSIPDHWGRAPK